MVILLLLTGMIKHSYTTQSNKFTIFLQYLEKKVIDGVYFSQVDEHKSFYKFAFSHYYY